MDLETFLVTVYCTSGDTVKNPMHGARLHQRGPAPRLGDSDVIAMEGAGVAHAGRPAEVPVLDAALGQGEPRRDRPRDRALGAWHVTATWQVPVLPRVPEYSRCTPPERALLWEAGVVEDQRHVGLGRQRMRRVVALADHVLYNLSSALSKQY